MDRVNSTIIPDLTEILSRFRQFDSSQTSIECRRFHRYITNTLKLCQNISYMQDQSESALFIVLDIRDFAYIIEQSVEHCASLDFIARTISNIHLLLAMIKTLVLY